jgi:hypothetical protein
MKTINLKNFKALVFTIAACYFSVSALAQNQVATPSPLPQAAPQKEMAKPAPTNSTMAMPGNNQGPSKEDMEQRKKMSELNKQIQEAEKAGNGATPEINAKKEELKKLQEQLRAKMMAENEKRRKENEAIAAKNNEANQKMNQLKKEINEADASGKGETPEIIAKKAELKKLQDDSAEREAKAKADREQMIKNRPQISPEDMEANKKMGQLSKEIREAEKENKGETPEIIAKKAELKKLQEARMAKMRAEREKMKVEQEKESKEKQNSISAPVKEEKKEEQSKK